jgi:N-carbamoylputrescine amidase
VTLRYSVTRDSGTVFACMRFKVALLQITPFGNDQSRNLAKGLDYCRQAKVLGADLAVFPELWSIGAELSPPDELGQRQWIAAALTHESQFLRDFATLARDLKMNIAVTYLEEAQPKPRNSVSIFNSEGRVTLSYSKVCICDFDGDGVNEAGCDSGCSAGNSFPICTLAGAEGDVKVGAMICSDREFPEPASQLMLNGAELIIIPNSCDWDEVRSAGLLTRACENLAGVAMANYPRPRNNGNSRAYSCVAWRDSDGRSPLIAVAHEEEEIVVAAFDIGEIREFRKVESWRLNHRYRLAERSK